MKKRISLTALVCLLIALGLISFRLTAETIVCFGDSLSAGYGAEAGHSYPDYLQADLDKEGFHARVLNFGVDGNTSKDGLERLKNVLDAHPDIVIFELGGNDGLRGAPVPQIKANLQTILSTLQRHHIRVLLAGIVLPPNYGPDYVPGFNAMYPALAAQYKTPFLPFLLANVWQIPEDMNADGIHPTARGYKVVAHDVEQVLIPMLKK